MWTGLEQIGNVSQRLALAMLVDLGYSLRSRGTLLHAKATLFHRDLVRGLYRTPSFPDVSPDRRYRFVWSAHRSQRHSRDAQKVSCGKNPPYQMLTGLGSTEKERLSSFLAKNMHIGSPVLPSTIITDEEGNVLEIIHRADRHRSA